MKNIFLVISVVFCLAAVSFVVWQVRATSSNNTYWNNDPQLEGLWLAPNNPHLAMVLRQERFTGFVKTAETGETDSEFLKVNMVTKGVAGEPDTNKEFPIEFYVPVYVNADSLFESKMNNGVADITYLTKAEMLHEINQEHDSIYTFELSSKALSGDRFDFASLISYYYSQKMQ